MTDDSFSPDRRGLSGAVEVLFGSVDPGDLSAMPATLPDTGLGETEALSALAPIVLGGGRSLGAPDSFDHMDPPTPWVTWATTLWNASLNQNLLHPTTAPVARDIEATVIGWLAPAFGMDGGHMTSGSTLSNLTALWAAREVAGIDTVVASIASHLSVAKAAHILGLKFVAVDADGSGRMGTSKLPDDLSRAALVLTAGVTNSGAIDDLSLAGKAAWTHVDAAWAGPLVLSETYADRLVGIDNADSVTVSAHKLLFQPKASGLIFFKNTKAAHQAVSFEGSYLSIPNVGVAGSHGAVAVPLLATLMAWGRSGLVDRIDRCMAMADTLWQHLDGHPDVDVFGRQTTGVILWRPTNSLTPADVFAALPPGSTSTTTIRDVEWVRHVSANPNADIAGIWDAIRRVLG